MLDCGYLVVVAGCIGGNSSRLWTSRTCDLALSFAGKLRLTVSLDSEAPPNRALFEDALCGLSVFFTILPNVAPSNLLLDIVDVLDLGELPTLLSERIGVVCSCMSCKRVKASLPSRLSLDESFCNFSSSMASYSIVGGRSSARG